MEISMFSMSIIVAGVITFIVVVAAFLFLRNFALSKQQRFETSLADLERQLKQRRISEKTYRDLRFNLDEKFGIKWYEKYGGRGND